MRRSIFSRLAAASMALMLMLSLAACGGTDQPGSGDPLSPAPVGSEDKAPEVPEMPEMPDTPDTPEVPAVQPGPDAPHVYSEEAQAAIDELFAHREWEQYLAVAYLGWREEGDSTDLAAWVHNEAPALAAFWPFLTEIPEEDIIGEHGHLYCVVPLEERIPFTVMSVEWEYLGNGATAHYSDPLYSTEVGKPFLLYTACETWLDDFDVVLEYEDEYTKIWHPCKELDGETIYGDEMILDFTHLYDVGDYVPDAEWLPPTELGLAGTTWCSDNGWLLEFGEDGSAENGMVLYQPVEGSTLSPYYQGTWWMEDDRLCLGVYEGHCPFPLLISPSGEQLIVMQADDGSVLPFFERGQTTVGLTLSYG